MAEAVHVVADLGRHAEFLQKISLTVQTLADKGFPVRNVTVRLDPPAAHDLPAAFRDARRISSNMAGSLFSTHSYMAAELDV